ncbi:LacI family DNA-binding transcriptional regulator [Halocella sp. SP3-1]|uniref:LacI family DNA-binding transcriptional regulator n=1 Tax=Halocella sp. SP3-1 TaxID=2382161 RepID=UPI00197AECFB|nr:LacI family DNA-binding transcriptional regulator [Halocella sp. SP3-1]
MATIKDVAKYAGVSIATVSKYLNGGNVLDKNKELIDEAVVKLDYQVNVMARGLKTNETMTVGIIIPSLTNLFFTTIVSKVENLLLQKGYSTIICDYREDEKLEKEKLNFLLSKNVDGIIMVPSCSEDNELINKVNKDLPVVLIDRNIEGVNCDVVLTDNINGSYDAVEQLIHRGHRRIGIICGPEEHYTAVERLTGYDRVHEDYNIARDKDLIRFGDYQIESGHQEIINLMKLAEPPTAIFVTNYEMTLGSIMGINELDIKMPDELSLIGYDNLQLAKIIKPSLSIVTQPMDEIGGTAAKLMLKRLKKDMSKHPAVYRLKSRIIIKDSVRKLNEG